MIKVNITTQDDKIIEFNCSGHSEYDDTGKDLICAAVSSMVIGTCNALSIMAAETSDFSMNEEEGFILIRVLEPNETTNTILQALTIQLETIEESYKEFITIRKMEV